MNATYSSGSCGLQFVSFQIEVGLRTSIAVRREPPSCAQVALLKPRVACFAEFSEFVCLGRCRSTCSGTLTGQDNHPKEEQSYRLSTRSCVALEWWRKAKLMPGCAPRFGIYLQAQWLLAVSIAPVAPEIGALLVGRPST